LNGKITILYIRVLETEPTLLHDSNPFCDKIQFEYFLHIQITATKKLYELCIFYVVYMHLLSLNIESIIIL